MEKKEEFEMPKMEIATFFAQDIIATSSGGSGIVLPDDEW